MICVAIVEDRPEIRETLGALIQANEGYSLAGSYSTMEAALEGLGAPLPDAMLIDLGLPGMSGIEGIRILRERYPGVALIVLTVFEDDRRIFDAICAGAQGYLFKSTPPAKLLEGVQEVLEGGAPMSPGVARRVLELFRTVKPVAKSDHDLTPHELRVLRLIVDGHNYKTAARELGVTTHTVAFHMKSIYGKLHVHSKAAAVSKALRHGFFQ